MIADTDNSRIRKVTPGGIMTTVAGGGEIFPGNGDGGPATSARLDSAVGVAVDTAGNLYIAERGSARIRKVSLAGIITTVAGNGMFGFSGDSGPATSAQLDFPVDVAVDTAGNLYIADLGNHRIRRVSPSGIITTVAGNGTPGFAGDGGPATSASLYSPHGVTVDTAGNLLIADRDNYVIRRVSSTGIISTVAGGGEESGDGCPATEVFLDFPLDTAVDGDGNVYIADQGSARIRKVLAGAPTLTVAPTTLSFSVPAGVERLESQQIAISSNALGLVWSAQESTENGGGWLAVASASGFAPGSVAVFVNASGLAPEKLSGHGENPGSRRQSRQLAVEPTSLSFQAGTGQSQPAAQSLRIRNAGGGALDWTARASTRSGGDWLAISPSSGSASASSSASVQVKRESLRLDGRSVHRLGGK